MAAFVSVAHTLDGRNLMAKGVAGKTISFTRIGMGDGYLSEDQTPREMTEPVHEVISLDVPENGVKDLGNGEVLIWAPFSNAAMDMGFYYRELYVWALDPDTESEILYCYGNAGNNAEWIPAKGGPTIIEKQVRVVTIIGEATHVTGNLNSGIILTPEDLAAHIGDMVMTEPGVHGLRYWMNTLEAWDGEKWIPIIQGVGAGAYFERILAGDVVLGTEGVPLAGVEIDGVPVIRQFNAVAVGDTIISVR